MQLTNIIVAVAASFVLPTQAQSPVAPAKAEGSVVAWPFDLTQVQLTPSRWMDNQNRSLAYLHFFDVNRMLYVFRNNHGLSTQGAATNGGWDAPSFPFRSHVQGHLLSALAQCYATTKDATCLSKAMTMTAELAKCQANNAKVGFKTGYLSGFPESEFDKLEQGQLTNGNVPYYCIHKTMAGLLDMWRWAGDSNAKTVLLNLAGWVDSRTARLSSSQMQSVLGTEFGGMGEVLTDLYFQTGDSKWLTTAARFFHNSVINPLASNQDQLNGLHANTNMPKFIHALRDYKATGASRSKAIGSNAWNIIQNTRIFAIGSTDEAEHFHGANQISAYLKSDSAETCPTYNYLKLTREMYAMNPQVSYFDYYEKGLINLILGQQRPSDSHGAMTYFNSMNAGGRRGLGPAWGGGTWSTDYSSFWCCMGTGLESHTKLYDSIYWYDTEGLYVNLFTPSVLNYAQMGVTVTQSTNFPVSGTTTLTIGGGDNGCAEEWTMRIRIPGWVDGTPTITVNGQGVTAASAGNYASIKREWQAGDVVKVTLPMGFRLAPANDNKALAAVAYGPVVMVGNYGSQGVSSAPTLQLGSLKRTSTSTLTFSGTANGQSVTLSPYYDAQEFNTVTYWMASGSLPSS